MAHGLPNGHVNGDVTWPWKVKLVTPKCLERNSSKTTWATSNLACSFVSGMPSGRTNNCPWKWAWPKSRDAYNFWHAIEISNTILELETSYLVHGLVQGVIISGSTKNFPLKWAWPTSCDPTIIGIRSNISSKLFELVTSSSNLVSGFDCRVLYTMVYCGAVRSAILATAWLLV